MVETHNPAIKHRVRRLTWIAFIGCIGMVISVLFLTQFSDGYSPEKNIVFFVLLVSGITAVISEFILRREVNGKL